MMQRAVRGPLAARLSVRTLKSIITADDISLCHPLPGGGCLPDSVFPSTLWMADVVIAHQPFEAVPVHALTGLGIALPLGPAVGHGAVENPDVPVR